jgi:hypothetical protein
MQLALLKKSELNKLLARTSSPMMILEEPDALAAEIAYWFAAE